MIKYWMTTLTLLFWLYAPQAVDAWDKAEGMRKHGNSKGNTPAIVIGCIVAAGFLGLIFMWSKDSKKKKKK